MVITGLLWLRGREPEATMVLGFWAYVYLKPAGPRVPPGFLGHQESPM